MRVRITAIILGNCNLLDTTRQTPLRMRPLSSGWGHGYMENSCGTRCDRVGLHSVRAGVANMGLAVILDGLCDVVSCWIGGSHSMAQSEYLLEKRRAIWTQHRGAGTGWVPSLKVYTWQLFSTCLHNRSISLLS